MLSSALVFVEVSVLNHDSATEEDKLKKEKGKCEKWGDKPDSINWCGSKKVIAEKKGIVGW